MVQRKRLEPVLLDNCVFMKFLGCSISIGNTTAQLFVSFDLLKQVTYFYDPDVGNFHFGPGHPMKVKSCL